MARGATSPAPATLPKVSFVKILNDTRPSGVHDRQARNYGFNDMSDFHRPEHYIRYIEPLDTDLAVQVEYDMDEQDQIWLDAVNVERAKEQSDKVTYELFEIIMDRLEKEWFDLTKNIPKPDMVMPSEDSTCAICDDSEGENTNAIVFCDGCNLAVHQDCYGVPYIPEGQWLCRKCTVSPENPVSCILCPNEGGAFKQTSHGDWVHLLCAIWVPETRVANDVFMEPITGVERISKQRWKLKCSVCEIKEGACIQCTKTSCFLAFHATCARKEKLLMPMKASQGSEAPTLACYCERHLPKEQQEARARALAHENSEGSDNNEPDGDPSSKSNKTARAYAKTYKPGPPLVPNIIVERILIYISRFSLRKKEDFVRLVCKYWSLKREARRGAPLLKRLHLEPWTASSGTRQHTDEEKALKVEYLKHLREELRRLKELASLIVKREEQKQEQVDIIQAVLTYFIFPHENRLRSTFEQIRGYDRLDYFKYPVSKADVPDYFEVITRPMCWDTIDRKLDMHEYWDLQDLEDDINLVLTNAMTYNKKDTPFHKVASRIQNYATPILATLRSFAAAKSETSVDSGGISTLDSETEVQGILQQSSAVGNLEPLITLLEPLISKDAIDDGFEFELCADPIVSLFNFELAKLKPKPPPPPPKPKRDRKADRQRKIRIREAHGILDSSPGFRAPRTRGALAAQAAFEAEAAGSSSNSLTAHEIESTAEDRAKLSKKRKRPIVVPSRQAEVVDAVNSQDMFKKFEEGWIYPSDHKRGGRPPVDRQPLPKKKSKTDHDKSNLSVIGTSVAENETHQSISPSAPPEHREEMHNESTEILNHFNDQIMESDQLPTPQTLQDVDMREPEVPTEESPTFEAHAMEHAQPIPVPEPLDDSLSAGLGTLTIEQPASGSEPPGDPPASVDAVASSNHEIVKQSTYLSHDPVLAELARPKPYQGIFIIEELDTPATRREKNMRRKAEREAARAAANAKAREAPMPVAGPSHNVDELIAHSELSSLSSLSDGDDDDESLDNEVVLHTRSAHNSTTLSSVININERGIIVPVNGRIEPGTLVWAKAPSYPWWAAEVMDPDNPMVPPAIRRQYVESQAPDHAPLHVIQFYDKIRSWQCLKVDLLRMLHEDFALDQELLANNSRIQRWKSPSIRNECRESYRAAVALIDTNDEHPTESADMSTNLPDDTDPGSPITDVDAN